MYDISGELKTLVKIQEYFQNACDYHHALILESIEKSFAFKFFKLFYRNMTPQDYYDDKRFTFEVKFIGDKTRIYYDAKMERISTWIHAIQNKHSFTIDEDDYRLFMSYKSIVKVN